MSSRSPIKRRPSSFVAALGTEIHSTGSVVSDENGEVLQLKQRSNHSGKARQLLFDSNQKAIASPFQAQENKLANPNSTVKMRRPLSARRNSPNLASPDKEKLSSLSPSLVKSTPTSQPRARSVTASELANDPDLPLKYRSLMIQYHRQTKTLRELKDSHRQIVIQAGAKTKHIEQMERELSKVHEEAEELQKKYKLCKEKEEEMLLNQKQLQALLDGTRKELEKKNSLLQKRDERIEELSALLASKQSATRERSGSHDRAGREAVRKPQTRSKRGDSRTRSATVLLETVPETNEGRLLEEAENSMIIQDSVLGLKTELALCKEELKVLLAQAKSSQHTSRTFEELLENSHSQFVEMEAAHKKELDFVLRKQEELEEANERLEEELHRLKAQSAIETRRLSLQKLNDDRLAKEMLTEELKQVRKDKQILTEGLTLKQLQIFKLETTVCTLQQQLKCYEMVTPVSKREFQELKADFTHTPAPPGVETPESVLHAKTSGSPKRAITPIPEENLQTSMEASEQSEESKDVAKKRGQSSKQRKTKSSKKLRRRRRAQPPESAGECDHQNQPTPPPETDSWKNIQPPPESWKELAATVQAHAVPPPPETNSFKNIQPPPETNNYFNHIQPPPPETNSFKHIQPPPPETSAFKDAVPPTQETDNSFNHIQPPLPENNSIKHVQPAAPPANQQVMPPPETSSFKHVVPPSPEINNSFNHIQPAPPETSSFKHVVPPSPETNSFKEMQPPAVLLPETNSLQHMQPPTPTEKEEDALPALERQSTLLTPLEDSLKDVAPLERIPSNAEEKFDETYVVVPSPPQEEGWMEMLLVRPPPTPKQEEKDETKEDEPRASRTPRPKSRRQAANKEINAKPVDSRRRKISSSYLFPPLPGPSPAPPSSSSSPSFSAPSSSSLSSSKTISSSILKSSSSAVINSQATLAQNTPPTTTIIFNKALQAKAKAAPQVATLLEPWKDFSPVNAKDFTLLPNKHEFASKPLKSLAVSATGNVNVHATPGAAGPAGTSRQVAMSEDERLARKLQKDEIAGFKQRHKPQDINAFKRLHAGKGIR